MAYKDISVEEKTRQLDQAVRIIQEQEGRTEEWKERAIREIYDKTRSRVMQQVQDVKDEIEEDLKVARKLAFAPPVLEGRNVDESHVARWYFAECDKLKDIREPQKVLELLNDAVLYSDHCRAKACLVQGYRLGNSEIVRNYLAAYPDEQAAWDAYSGAAENWNEFERASQVFSAAHRMKPLEAYLAS